LIFIIFDYLNSERMKKLSALFFLMAMAFSVVSQITWSEHVAPIAYEHCTTCHRQGGIGPFPIETYQDAYGYMFDIADAVSDRHMPPWPADPNYRQFLHENYLTDDQIQTINDWVLAGAPEGDPALAPELPSFTTGSALPSIDLSIQTPEYASTAAFNDVYRTFVVPSNFSVDKFIDGFEVIPGNASIVHHVVVYYDPSDECLTLDANDPGPGFTTSGTGGELPADAKFLAVWAPGKNTQMLPQGFALRAEAGGHFLIEIHFPTGTAGELDQTTVNVHYTTDSTPREVWLDPILNHAPPILQAPFLYIPANQTAIFEEIYEVPIDVTLFNVMPHMHLIGRSITSWAETPSSDSIPLIHIPEWHFHWQMGYDFTSLQTLPAGSLLKASAFFDNTTNNPNNPNDPPQLVIAGEATDEEMMVVFFTYTYYLPGDENIEIVTGVPALEKTPTKWSVYPNPTADLLHVQSFLDRYQKVQFSIFDQTGKKWMHTQENVQGGMDTSELDVSQLPAGIYYLQVTGDELYFTTSFIKQ